MRNPGYNAYWEYFPSKNHYADRYEQLANVHNEPQFNKPARDFITEEEQQAREEGRFYAVVRYNATHANQASNNQAIPGFAAHGNNTSSSSNPSVVSILGNALTLCGQTLFGAGANSHNQPTISSITAECHTLYNNVTGNSGR